MRIGNRTSMNRGHPAAHNNKRLYFERGLRPKFPTTKKKRPGRKEGIREADAGLFLQQIDDNIGVPVSFLPAMYRSHHGSRKKLTYL